MKRSRPPKGGSAYQRLWRVVEGAVADAFAQHPEYLTAVGARGRCARLSVTKRVTGAVLSFAEQSAGGPIRREAARLTEAEALT